MSKNEKFKSGLEDGGVDRKKAAKAKGADSLIAGNYIRKTFTWTEGQLDMIEEIATALGLSKFACARWLMDMGIQAYQEGQRPETSYNPSDHY